MGQAFKRLSMRWTMQYRGRVQGVGFRARACEIASRFAVSGYVQNLPDRSVRLVAEGAPEELAAFSSELERQLGHFIRGVERVEDSGSAQYEGFEIRY